MAQLTFLDEIKGGGGGASTTTTMTTTTTTVASVQVSKEDQLKNEAQAAADKIKAEKAAETEKKIQEEVLMDCVLGLDSCFRGISQFAVISSISLHYTYIPPLPRPNFRLRPQLANAN